MNNDTIAPNALAAFGAVTKKELIAVYELLFAIAVLKQLIRGLRDEKSGFLLTLTKTCDILKCDKNMNGNDMNRTGIYWMIKTYS